MATINPWKQFQGLLPKQVQVIGIVTGHNSNGTSIITLRDGSIMTAKSHGVAVGSMTLVERGEVMREVPSLPVYNAQV